MIIREMTIDDYDEVYEMWQITTKRALSKADEKDQMERYLKHNAGMSQVAVVDGDLGVDDLLALHDCFLEHPLPAGKVDAAGQHGDERHDDVAHERGRDLAERTANDNADGHIDDVAAHGKGLELFKKLLHGKYLFAENVQKMKTYRIKTE